MRKNSFFKVIVCLTIAAMLMGLNFIPAFATSATDFNFDASTGTITRYLGAGISVEIPSEINGVAVKSIGTLAFDYCCSLTSITIPSSVTSIGNNAFSNCQSLTSITIPSSITYIPSLAFYECYNLASITIPSSVTSIGNRVFEFCSSLASITIPDSVTSIGYGIFNGCSGLTSITIPASVTSIGDYAFDDCSKLTISTFHGCYAESYAISNSIPVSYIDNNATPTPTPTPTDTPTPTPTATPALTPTPTPTPTPPPASSGIINANMSTDMSKYIQGETVQLALKLTNTQPGDKTNSVTFQIDYDGNTFEPLTGNLDSDIANGYLPSNVKLELGSGSSESILVSYVNMNNDITLQEEAKVFTARFKVKKNPAPGTKSFTLRPITMLDSGNKAYNVNNGDAETATVEITDNAAIEGYMNIYLGDSGTDLNTGVLDKLDQSRINDTLKNLNFTLKRSQSDTGIQLKGSQVFIPDENGNLAVRGADDKVKGRFRVFTADPENAILSLSSAGYLKKNILLPALNVSKLSPVNAPYTSAELNPGDIGQVNNLTLELTPDDKITNADFSAWLKTYKDSVGVLDVTSDMINADFTKDKEIDNVDFSLWLATYKKILTVGQ